MILLFDLQPYADLTGEYPKGMMPMLTKLGIKHEGRHHSGIGYYYYSFLISLYRATLINEFGDKCIANFIIVWYFTAL
jgi:hypothetical protein